MRKSTARMGRRICPIRSNSGAAALQDCLPAGRRQSARSICPGCFGSIGRHAPAGGGSHHRHHRTSGEPPVSLEQAAYPIRLRASASVPSPAGRARHSEDHNAVSRRKTSMERVCGLFSWDGRQARGSRDDAAAIVPLDIGYYSASPERCRDASHSPSLRFWDFPRPPDSASHRTGCVKWNPANIVPLSCTPRRVSGISRLFAVNRPPPACHPRKLTLLPTCR